MATGALDDVKVLDFTWVLAGPGLTRILADYGATVVKVEPTRAGGDTIRGVVPFLDGKPGANRSGNFQNYNAGKLGVTLDLSKPKGIEVAKDLIRWADVVTESFSPKAMRSWGFDYEGMRKIKSDIIMVSSCLMGQTGPLRMFAGFGNQAAAMIGFYYLCSWPDRPPAGPFVAYTDYISPLYSATAVLAALEHHRRTGEGTYIDQSQAESSLQFLGVPLLDYSANGRVWGPVANYDPNWVPHGVYPAAGEDHWAAIVCKTDEQWRALCSATHHRGLADDARFARFEDRQNNRAELDRLIAEWSARHPARAIEHQLQELGIAAYAVQGPVEIYDDPQMQHRHHFIDVKHPEFGKFTVENSRFKLSRTPAHIENGGPLLGQHNQYVLEKILGYSEEKIHEVVNAGGLG